MPYYSRWLKEESWISASFNHRPQPPTTLESPSKTWRHWVPRGPEMNQRDLQIGHGFVGCNSAMAMPVGLKSLAISSRKARVSENDRPEVFLLEKQGSNRRFIRPKHHNMDGFGWFPGCTLRRLQQGFLQKPVFFFQGNCYPFALDDWHQKITKSEALWYSLWCFPLASQQRLAWEGLSFHQSIDIFGICFGWHLGCLTGFSGGRNLTKIPMCATLIVWGSFM